MSKNTSHDQNFKNLILDYPHQAGKMHETTSNGEAYRRFEISNVHLRHQVI